MRINLIGSFSGNTGLRQDSALLRGLIANQYPDAEIRKVQHFLPECAEAEINIFIETLNPALFISAGLNVWIPNPEWAYKTWIPYIEMLDEIWVKTHEAETIFKQYAPLKVQYIGWTSIDKIYFPKNYSKAIVLVGKNPYRHPKPILKAYYDLLLSDPELYKQLPDLYIPHRDMEIYMPPPLSEKVHLLGELKESEYDQLLQECGLAICTSACEGFGHAVNEAMSTGCVMILSDIQPFHQLSMDAFFCDTYRESEHPKTLCKLIDTSSLSLRTQLRSFMKKTPDQLKKLSVSSRLQYEKRHRKFIQDFKIPCTPDFCLDKTFVPECDLPYVSIVTLTYNRPEFIPLAKYSYLIQSYPEEKLEWIIVNDGESIEELLIGIPNVTYVQLDQKMSIAEKRNIGVKKAMYDVLVMMDDDDVYPNNSVLFRVSMMMKSPQKECVFCTTIPCYDIEKRISFMNVPPNILEMSERVSEASLCFTRRFFNERWFEDLPEGDKFIRGREQMCREISPQNVIVSLVHSKNISSRKISGEANGCHYGFCDELFGLIESISCPTSQDCL
jgi:hypothetical protein